MPGTGPGMTNDTQQSEREAGATRSSLRQLEEVKKAPPAGGRIAARNNAPLQDAAPSGGVYRWAFPPSLRGVQCTTSHAAISYFRPRRPPPPSASTVR